MHSEPAIENHAPCRRRRKRGNGSDGEGPVFVDTSGRRSKLLRRIGVLVGVLCLGYAVVLGLAFLGIGTSSPSSLLPFGGGQGGPAGQSGTGPDARPQGGAGDVVQPSGSPPALPSGVPTPSASANAG
ncbi:hypothetical protein [Streptomyces sp. NPDC057280]|uniref:hypothetical protein n=1 Tax=Streptomyces sp. NPDC057280 TaxID=3346081 RepID=UPI0009A2C8BC|nr:hypothetical protein B1R27_03515 [Streptomyces sp. GKU 895]